MPSSPDFRLPRKEAPQEDSSDHRHTLSTRSSYLIDSSRRVYTRTPQVSIFDTFWGRRATGVSPEINILSQLDKISGGLPVRFFTRAPSRHLR